MILSQIKIVYINGITKLICWIKGRETKIETKERHHLGLEEGEKKRKMVWNKDTLRLKELSKKP